MLKRIIHMALVLSLCISISAAESFSGITAAASTVTVEIPAEAVVEKVEVELGDAVKAGQELAVLREHAVFSFEDGIVGVLEYKAGDIVDGTVLKVAPSHQYHLYCTIKEAYNKMENKLIYTGEILYAKCTKDGSHRAVVKVISVDGKEFEAFSVGGQLFIGETVYLYRDEAFDATARVGIATVVAEDAMDYDCKGYLCDVDVENGEEVKRGEKLFTWCEAEKPVITAKQSGVITAVYLSNGQSCESGIAFEMMPEDALRIDIYVDENDLTELQSVQHYFYTRADDENDIRYPASLESISKLSEGNDYRIRLLPQDKNLPIGMHVEVITE